MKKYTLIFLSLATAISLPYFASAQGITGNWGYNNMMGWAYNNGFFPLGILAIIACILFWVLVIGLIVMLVRRIAGHTDYKMRGHNSALDILKERYAKGEINKEEFEQKKKDLM